MINTLIRNNSVCHRKLSFTIQLSDDKDYKNDVEFIVTKDTTFRQKLFVLSIHHFYLIELVA